MLGTILSWFGLAVPAAKRARFSADSDGMSIDLLRLLKALITLWFLMFLLSRYLMYDHALSHAVTDLEDSHYMAQKCLDDPRHRRIEAKSCAEHIARRNTSLHKAALEYVIENTYLCGYASCESIVSSLFVQIGVAAAVALGAGVGVYLLAVRYCVRQKPNYIGYEEPEPVDYDAFVNQMQGPRLLEVGGAVRHRRPIDDDA